MNIPITPQITPIYLPGSLFTKQDELYHCFGITGPECTVYIITKMKWLISRWIILTT
ncbi:uncharacterized protein METZ01_LOCUS399038, partial [marine metagenome]